MHNVKTHGTVPKGHLFPIISWLIRLFAGSRISHCITELDDGRIYHAHFNIVEFEDKEEFLKKNKIINSYEFNIPSENYEAMLDFAETYKGKKEGYFFKLCGSIIPQLVRFVTGKFINNTFSKGIEKNITCSQLVRFMAVRYWNFKVPALPYSDNFTTRDFIELMEENT